MIRERALSLVKKPAFDYTILFFIFLSSIHLVLDSPLKDPNGKLNSALHVVDIILTVIFVLEAILKMYAYGIIFNGPESYFRVIWNLLDFVIVVISVTIFF